MKRLSILMFVAIAITGASILLYVFWKLQKADQFKNQAVKTMGIVTGYNTKEGYEKVKIFRKILYAPIVTYSLNDGVENTFNSHSYNREKPFEIGERITVYLDKENPKKVIIDLDYLYNNKFKFIISGICFLLIGLVGVLVKFFYK